MRKSKAQRFKDVFPPRVKRIEKKLETLGNCSRKNNYEWKQDQVMRAFGSLMRKFIECADLFGVTVTAQVDGIEVRTFDS
jgi:hypothetical protein